MTKSFVKAKKMKIAMLPWGFLRQNNPILQERMCFNVKKHDRFWQI